MMDFTFSYNLSQVDTPECFRLANCQNLCLLALMVNESNAFDLLLLVLLIALEAVRVL